MVFPTTSINVHLPEELGIIQNVNGVIELLNKEKIIVPCKHIERYCSLDEKTWPKIFDENSKQILISHKISNNDNTSVFEGFYTFFNETYLEGTLYFTFDFCKDSYWHHCTTNSSYFKENKNNYYDLLALLN